MKLIEGGSLYLRVEHFPWRSYDFDLGGSRRKVPGRTNSHEKEECSRFWQFAIAPRKHW